MTQDRLESWKEIAAYFGRDTRTVQRWEEAECLPIHRQQHKKTSSVYAFKSELELWRIERDGRGNLQPAVTHFAPLSNNSSATTYIVSALGILAVGLFLFRDNFVRSFPNARQ
jgi:hypothetical protein